MLMLLTLLTQKHMPHTRVRARGRARARARGDHKNTTTIKVQKQVNNVNNLNSVPTTIGCGVNVVLMWSSYINKH